MAVPTKPRPSTELRRNPLDMAPAPIEAELAAQLETRAERRKERDTKRRAKATWDIPEALQQLVARMAAAEDVAQSDIVALAIVRLRADLDAGLDLAPYKQPARSLRATYKLNLPTGAKQR